MKQVPPSGSLDAPVLWIGEAPGKDEVAKGEPFVGASGRVVRSTLKWAGISEDQVRFTNAVKINPGTFPAGRAGDALLQEWGPQLDVEMGEMTDLRVIVLCGSQALRRLTGRTSIQNWHGSVLRNKDLPDVLHWNSVQYVNKAPENILIIPVLHPAGIIRSKSRDGMFLFRRAVTKVKSILQGTLRSNDFQLFVDPKHSMVRKAAKDAQWVYFDTEFHKETREVFWIGLTFDGERVFGMQWDGETADLVHELMKREDLIKGAHNIVEDASVLENYGINVLGEWFDTMIVHHQLYPSRELRYNLGATATYYLDDVKYWKDMDHRDPMYNAKDVAYGAMCMEKQKIALRARPVSPLKEFKARMTLLKTTKTMRNRGMLVDRWIQGNLLAEVNKEIAEKVNEIRDATDELWGKRASKAAQTYQSAEDLVQSIREAALHGSCAKHPRNSVLRKAPECTTCTQAWALGAEKRDAYTSALCARDTAKREWGGLKNGFKATNPHHLRWLLYSKEALGLPTQRDPNTRRVTTSSAAIAKLDALTKVKRNSEKFKVVRLIKDVQGLEKAKSTFILLQNKDEQSIIDDDGYAHPPYKVHGTETGRLASGKGEDTDEKSDYRYTINALNIPEQWRRMYVAPAGCCLVGADWRNVEGRLTAHFSGDPTYIKALQGELEGGPKVHSLNASVIYGISPDDASNHLVRLGNSEKPAYDAGKRLTHAWSYGMGPHTMTRHFGITLKEAQAIDEKLSAAYPQLVKWREELVQRVLGKWKRVYGDWICDEPGNRFLANPFGWQKYWLGVSGSQRNEVIAFLPQSSGAGMWTRTAPILEECYPVMTGTYDSFVLIVPKSKTDVREATSFLKSTMERPWPELGDKTFPCELSVGYNWGKWSKNNERGLKEVA